MSGTAAWRQWKVPVRLTASRRSQLAGLISVKGSNESSPALVTMIPIGPSSARTFSSAASMAARSVTSTSAPIARAPPARSPSAAWRAASPFRSNRATRSPRPASCRPIASPIPDAPPVTTATRSMASSMPTARTACNNVLDLRECDSRGGRGDHEGMEEQSLARFQKPAAGSWTEHHPELGTGLVCFEDSISPSFYQLEREAVFQRAWRNIGRIEQLPRDGSYFTKQIPGVGVSVLVARDQAGRVRAFHNVCRHRGNKLVWEGTPRDESSGSARQFVCKYHGWRYGLDGACSYVHQQDQFFDLRKNELALAPIHCDTWAGFIFVSLA